MAMSKVKSRSHHDISHLQPQLITLPSINFLHPVVSEISPGQNFKGKDHNMWDKVTSRNCTFSSPTNIPTKYQLPKLSSFRNIAQPRFTGHGHNRPYHT